MRKIFIDGSAGTTGLRIRERLAGRAGLELITLREEVRKDVSARRDALNAADLAFLCLPDAAAVEAVALVENPSTVVIDTSTAHRTSDEWEYGFPELAGRRDRIRIAKRIANPGCHASGMIALLQPLVASGIISPAAPLAVFSLTGYSGGGKKMIAEYEERGPHDAALASRDLYAGGRQYAMGQSHKHLPEVVKICALGKAPVFSPIIVPHYSGMETTVMVHGEYVRGGLAAIEECLRASYGGTDGVVRFRPASELPAILSSVEFAGRDDMVVTCHGNDERIVITSLFDNLGKGASGAAIQNMNIVLGLSETEGLAV